MFFKRSARSRAARLAKKVLLERGERGLTLFIVGAGISADAPSKAPMSIDLVKDYLSHYLPTNADADLVLSHFSRRGSLIGQPYPRLEFVLDRIVEIFGIDALAPLSTLSQLESNRNHRLLATMSDFTPILTTNIDCCIEKAKGGTIRRTVGDSDIDSENDSVAFYPLTKLHGSADGPIDELGVTTNALRFGLDNVTTRLIRAVWTMGGTVVVAGYSGGDSADVWNILRQIAMLNKLRNDGTRSSPRIIWIFHSSESPRLLKQPPDWHLGFELMMQIVDKKDVAWVSGPTYDVIHAISSVLLADILDIEYEEPSGESPYKARNILSGVTPPPEGAKNAFRDRLFCDAGLIPQAMYAMSLDIQTGSDVPPERCLEGILTAALSFGAYDLVQFADPTLEKMGLNSTSSAETIRLSSYSRECGFFSLAPIHPPEVERIRSSIEEARPGLISILRPPRDAQLIDVAGEWLARLIAKEFIVRGNYALSNNFEGLHRSYAQHRSEIISVFSECAEHYGVLLLNFNGGVKLASGIKYLQELTLMGGEDDDWMQFAQSGDRAIKLAEILVGTQPHDCVHAALNLQQFRTAFDALTYILESYMVCLHRPAIEPTARNGISKSFPHVLSNLWAIANMFDVFDFKKRAEKYTSYYYGIHGKGVTLDGSWRDDMRDWGAEARFIASLCKFNQQDSGT